MFSGLPQEEIEELSKLVVKLGASIEEKEIRKATHLVTDKIRRTLKFMCGISVCAYIVHYHWLTQSNHYGYLLDETPFILEDSQAEKQFKFQLKESLRRAKEKPLFKSYSFFITPSVENSNVLRHVIECAGGEILQQMPTKEEAETTVIACLEDIKYCGENISFIDNKSFYFPEFVYASVLKQQIETTHSFYSE